MMIDEKLKAIRFQKIAFYVFAFSLFTLGLGHIAFADSGYAAVGSSIDPNSGNDPWAIFQLMISVGMEIWYVIKVVLLISGILGLLFIILGLLKIRASALDSQSGGSHLKHGIILVILGGLMFGAPTLMEMSGYSLFGSAPAPVATNGTVNCQMVNGQYSQGCGNPCASGVATQNADGTSTCQCPEGTDQSNGCQPCPAGQGNSNSGGACANCPSGSGTSGGMCVQCTGNTGVVSGVCAPCPPSTIPVNGVCTACPSGEFVSNGACVTQCPNGQTVPTPAWNQPSLDGTCQPCPSLDGYAPNKNAPGCICAAGYYENPNVDNCTKCPNGTTGTDVALTGCICANNAYWTGSGCSCVQYASFNAEGVCNCNAGYVGSAGACVQCQAGTYAAVGASSCTTCAAGTYAAAGASSCATCAQGTYSNVGDSACISCAGVYGTIQGCNCASGLYASGGNCVSSCPSGSYGASGYCSQCQDYQYGQVSTCPCTPAMANDGIHDYCTCGNNTGVAGYTHCLCSNGKSTLSGTAAGAGCTCVLLQGGVCYTAKYTQAQMQSALTGGGLALTIDSSSAFPGSLAQFCWGIQGTIGGYNTSVSYAVCGTNTGANSSQYESCNSSVLPTSQCLPVKDSSGNLDVYYTADISPTYDQDNVVAMLNNN